MTEQLNGVTLLYRRDQQSTVNQLCFKRGKAGSEVNTCRYVYICTYIHLHVCVCAPTHTHVVHFYLLGPEKQWCLESDENAQCSDLGFQDSSLKETGLFGEVAN